MAQENGDHEMADATAGAEANGSDGGDFAFEKQRLRVVRRHTTDEKVWNTSDVYIATGRIGQCGLVRIRTRRPHAWKCIAVSDYEEVWVDLNSWNEIFKLT